MRRIYANRYLCDESILRPSFVGQQTVEHMDLFPVQTSSCTFPLGEKKILGWCWCWWRVNTPLQPKTQSLLSCWNLRVYLLVPSCGPCSRFALALFQVWEVKCKQFTDLLWLGRAKGFSWEECNLNTTSQGGSAARWSIHAYWVRAYQETDPAVQGRTSWWERLLTSVIMWGGLAEAKRPLGFRPMSYHSWYFIVDYSRFYIRYVSKNGLHSVEWSATH